jgi:hypothetical protein
MSPNDICPREDVTELRRSAAAPWVLRGLALGTTSKDVWSRWAVSAAAALNLAWPECTDATDRGRGCPSESKGRILHEAAKKDLGKGGIGHAESSSRAQHSGEHLREETERSRTAPGQDRIANIAFYELRRYCPSSGHRGRLGGVRWIRRRKPAFYSGSSSWGRADRGTPTSWRADGTSPADCANSAADYSPRIHNVGFRPARSDPATLAAGCLLMGRFRLLGLQLTVQRCPAAGGPQRRPLS